MGKGHKKKQHVNKKRVEQSPSACYVSQWAFLCKNGGLASSSSTMDSSVPPHLLEWLPSSVNNTTPVVSASPLIIDLHTHSTCSDGTLSPTQLVDRAAANGVQVLALTDHDTMAGITEALEAANKHLIRLIPGVEISAKVSTSMKNGVEEPVHILAYYGCCGPAKWEKLEEALAWIREGRHHRAKAMINKLRTLKKPVKWERVEAMAGFGVAPGRVHIARALVEAGHVLNLREAFSKYLHDGGPAYAVGYEMAAEDAVRLVCDTGGVAVLAHPWCLKDPFSVVKKLKNAGLHGMEVYRGDGKAAAFATLAETFGLLKLGGSDYHARGEPDEVKLGRVPLPAAAIREFLLVAEPIWSDAIRGVLHYFAEEKFEISLSKKLVGLKYFTGDECLKGDISVEFMGQEVSSKVLLRLSPWLTEEERLAVSEEAALLKLDVDVTNKNGKAVCIIAHSCLVNVS